MADIRKAGGVFIKDRCFLVTKSFGKDIFVAPGGKLEQGESAVQALERELREELGVKINVDTIELLDVLCRGSRSGRCYARDASIPNL